MNVLFLCTGNSARSIFAEALLNHFGGERFRGYSAGSQPRGEVHPLTLYELERRSLPTAGLRSKDWQEFARPDAPPLDLVITVCDRAAAEACPVWPGQPLAAHWGIEDPAAVEGEDWECKAAFAQACRHLHNRISIFINLPFASLDALRLQQHLDDIGRTPPPAEPGRPGPSGT